MDEHQELCDTGLFLGLNYDSKNTVTPVDQKPQSKPDIASNFLKLESSHEPSLTLSLFADKSELPKVSINIQSMCLIGKVSQIQSPTQSTVSSFSDDQPLPEAKTENDTESDELDKVASHISGGDDEDGHAKKKLRLSKEQSILLELKFKEQSTLNPKQKQALAKQLNLRPRQVEVWFQNRRARTKLKQTQVDCEYLKKYCESLTEENRRLKKELQELRTLKGLSSTVYMQVPKAALTICSSCEKIISSSTDKVHGSIEETNHPVAMTPKLHFFNPFAHSTAC